MAILDNTMTEKNLKDIFPATQNNSVIWFAPSYRVFRWDIFTIFDCVIVSRKSGKISFAQITTISNISHRRKKIYDFMRENKCYIKNSFIYAYNEKKGKWKIEKIKPLDNV